MEKKLILVTPGGIKFIWTSSPPPPLSLPVANPDKVSAYKTFQQTYFQKTIIFENSYLCKSFCLCFLLLWQKSMLYTNSEVVGFKSFSFIKGLPNFQPTGNIDLPRGPYSLHGYSGRLSARLTSFEKAIWTWSHHSMLFLKAARIRVKGRYLEYIGKFGPPQWRSHSGALAGFQTYWRILY